MRRGGLALVLMAGAATAWLAAGPVMAEDAAGQVEVRPAPPGAYTPADPNMIAVADHGNDRIQVFWPNGTFAFKFGSDGYGVDEFQAVQDVAVGPDGRIFVLDLRHSHPVRAFHPDGSFAFSMGSDGSALGQYFNPRGIDVGPDGRIVVSDDGYYGDGRGRIQVFQPNGEFELAFNYNYVRSYASDVAVGPDGLIFVHCNDDGGGVYSAWCVQVFHPNGSLAAEFAALPRDDRSRIAVGPDGRVFLPRYIHWDYVSHPSTVSVFHPYTDRNGSLAYRPALPNGTDSNGTVTFGPPVVLRGLGDGWLDVAVGPNGRAVVSSEFNHSIQVFHPNGSLALAFGSYGALREGFDSPTDVAVGPDGRIVVAEPGSNSIQVFHPNGSLAAEFGSRGAADGEFYAPARVAVGPDGQIVVADTRKMRIQVFRPDSNGTSYAFDGVAFGSHGGGERQFRSLGAVAVGPDGRIVAVGDARVKVFHPNGSLALSYVHDMLMKSVAVGPDGRIVVGGDHYTAVTRDSAVDVFHPNGSHALRLDTPLGAFHVAVAPTGLIVAGGGGVVQAFHPDGTLLFDRQVDIDVAGIAVGPDGRIVAVDTGRKLVHVFEADGSFAFSLLPSLRDGAFNYPIAVAVGPMSIPASAGPPAPLIAAIVPLGPSGGQGAGGLGGGGGPPVPHNFTDAGDSANVTIDVGGLAEPGAAPLNGSESSTVTFPASGAVVAASFATVSFPPNVTAAHVPAGGLLALHISANVPDDRLVLEALAPNGSGAVVLRRVVEVGGANASVVFDLPVRILLEGQAGGRAFYIAGANGTITPVDEACAADDTAGVHAQLGGSGECQMDSTDGGGKIVYTYHLTRFGTAELSPAPVIPGPPPQPPTPPLPDVSPPEPAAPPVVHTCSVSLGSANLDLRATAGGYSDPVRQALRNTGSLALEHVELRATMWKDVGPLPAPAPAPSLPPPVVGTDTGRASAVLTAVLVAGLPASVTELSTDARGAAPYAPLANGTAVAHGLEGGAEEPIWFRMNLSDRAGMQGGTFVQTITYQAQCAQP